MLSLAARILLYLYIRRSVPPSHLELESIRRGIDRCVSYRERKEMEEELDYLKG